MIFIMKFLLDKLLGLEQ